MSRYVLIIFVFLSSFCSGQADYFTCKKIISGKDFAFPVFSKSTPDPASERVNQLLQLSELEMLKGHEKKNIFETVNPDTAGAHGRKIKMAYSLLNNSGKLLSIKFDESSCGSSCASWVSYYNFNPGNGDLIHLKDLFTPEGFEIFRERVLIKRTKKFMAEIQKVDSTKRGRLLEVREYFKDDALQDFYIDKNNICIDGLNFLTKNQKLYNLDMVTKLDLSEFKKCLNDFGNAMFALSADPVSKFHSTALPQLFSGTFSDGRKILLVLNDLHGGMKGVYAFTTTGKGIYMEGSLDKTKLSMTEYNRNFEESAYIDATFDGKNLKGTWRSKDRTKNYKIDAAIK